MLEAYLNHRGWVLQERLLSRRTLHFAKDRVYWECGHHIVAEDGLQHKNCDDTPEMRPEIQRITDYGTMPTSFNTLYKSMVLTKTFGLEYSNGSSLTVNLEKPAKNPFTQFLVLELTGIEIIRSYSRCMLTMQSDKLLALLGLASKMGVIINAQYLFGYWFYNNHALPHSLMWFTQGTAVKSNRIRSLPWSCMSLDTPLEFYHIGSVKPRATLLRIVLSTRHGLKHYTSLIISGPIQFAFRGPENSSEVADKPRYFYM